MRTVRGRRLHPMPIPAPVFEHFAADPGGPFLSLGVEAQNGESPIRSEIETFLSSIDTKEVEEIRSRREFRERLSESEDPDRQARIWTGARLLSQRIATCRLQTLRADSTVGRPHPYDQDALADLTPDEDNLVPLREFEFDGTRLLRNGHAFLIMSTTAAPNSTYWLLQSCYADKDLHEHARIRLDPFLHGPAESFFGRVNLMLEYGRALDWDRIENLRKPDHGRWLPESADHSRTFTDYAWTPRDSEVHFVCEEVPTADASATEGGRYLHAIYVQSTAAIAHFDLAVRVYDESDLAKRQDQHVRHAGKIGLRKKVFRVDHNVPRSVFASVCQAFFVWNDDVRKYFERGCRLEASDRAPLR